MIEWGCSKGVVLITPLTYCTHLYLQYKFSVEGAVNSIEAYRYYMQSFLHIVLYLCVGWW